MMMTLLGPSHVLAMWQQDSINSGNSKLLMIFVGLAAFALLVQALVFVVLAGGAIKGQKALLVHVEEFKAHLVEFKEKAMPLIASSHALVTDLTPPVKAITAKVHEITVHVEDIAALAREKAHEFSPTISAANETVQAANQTVRDANHKTQEQVVRVNEMITSALDATAQLGKAIQHGITQPGREIAGVVSGVKAAFDSLLHKSRGFGSGAMRSTPTYPAAVPPARPLVYGRPDNKDKGL